MMHFGAFLSMTETSVFEEIWNYLIEKYLTPKYSYYQNIEINPDPLISPATVFFAVFFSIMVACAVTVFTRRTLGRPVRLLLKHDAIGRRNAKTLSEIGLKKTKLLSFFINRYTLSKAIRCVEEDEFYGIEEEEADTEAKAEEVSDTAPDEPEEDSSESAPVEYTSRRDAKRAFKAEKREANKRLSPEKVAEISSRSRNAYYLAAASKVKYKRKVDTDRFYIEEGLQYRAQIRFSAKGSNPMLLLVVAVAYIIIGVAIIKFLPNLLSFADAALGSFK